MTSLQQNTLNFNKSISYDFNGGNLSSDAGLIAVRSFDEAIGFTELIEKAFKPNPSVTHSKASVISQLVYTTIAGYFNDDDSDALRNDPVLNAVLDKNGLASQPTISRNITDCTEEDIKLLNSLFPLLFESVYNYKNTECIILDIDSTLSQTYGKQEDGEFNYHYRKNGYHPLVLYNGVNGDLLKIQLRKGSAYTSTGVDEFLRPVLEWISEKYPDTQVILRGDSGFATPDVYNLIDEFRYDYIIKLKNNAVLYELAGKMHSVFLKTYANDYSKYHVLYDSFEYKADSWDFPQRVVCKIERAPLELVPRISFITTSLISEPEICFKAYNKRGNMENFIKETKLDFGMETLSHKTFVANHVKCLIKSLAYNLINIMKRMVMPESLKKNRMLSLRSMFVKIACRLIKSGRRMTLRLSSNTPYQKHFNTIMENIAALT